MNLIIILVLSLVILTKYLESKASEKNRKTQEITKILLLSNFNPNNQTNHWFSLIVTCIIAISFAFTAFNNPSEIAKISFIIFGTLLTILQTVIYFIKRNNISILSLFDRSKIK